MKYDYSKLPEEFRPISMWGYFGWTLLFGIPFIGFILLCVIALGAGKNVNLRNYARSFFCVDILILIVVGTVVLITALTGGLTALAGGLGAFSQMYS